MTDINNVLAHINTSLQSIANALTSIAMESGNNNNDKTESCDEETDEQEEYSCPHCHCHHQIYPDEEEIEDNEEDDEEDSSCPDEEDGEESLEDIEHAYNHVLDSAIDAFRSIVSRLENAKTVSKNHQLLKAIRRDIGKVEEEMEQHLGWSYDILDK